ncbi:unnamed protein product [Toxocara canis]|uniref:Retrotransposon protein n=1 Tax=Toxocara canis TaxID=6265 RepID=A0A183U4P8_TOXCA|nr:unnamed protein product [Toxocara canis]
MMPSIVDDHKETWATTKKVPMLLVVVERRTEKTMTGTKLPIENWMSPTDKKTKLGYCTMISCTDSLTCGGYQRYAWLRKRAYVARLAERKNYKAAMHRWAMRKKLV